jgi:UDP-N-acetylmuramate dehydrogenase
MADLSDKVSVSDPLTFDLQAAQAAFGERLETGVPMGRYTAARVGGPAAGLVQATSAEDLAEVASRLWELRLPFIILGGGSNILVSDRGYGGIVVLNKARQVRFDLKHAPPWVWAESGANFGSLARQAALKGCSGLEWAAGIPGTLGGAIAGNAGAHGGDTAGRLRLADILHRVGPEIPRGNGRTTRPTIVREKWTAERFQFAYRSSVIKKNLRKSSGSGFGGVMGTIAMNPDLIVLAAWFGLEKSTREAVGARMEEYLQYRRQTQPPGASMGSMFKNPPGDYAGRLIEAAGLKGLQVGKAQISPLHANFFINRGGAMAADIWQLIRIARERVAETFGVQLELEIELVGDWSLEAEW